MVCTSAGKGLNLVLWKPIQQPEEPALSLSKCCPSTYSHLLQLQPALQSQQVIGTVNSAHSMLRQAPQQHVQHLLRILTHTQNLSTDISLQWLFPVTLSQQLPKNGTAQCSPCCSELRSFWSHCFLQNKKVTAEADGFLCIWVEREVVWAVLGKRPNAMEEAVNFWGMQDGLLQDHWSPKGLRTFFRKAEDQINDKKNELAEGDGDKREYWEVKVLGHEIEINPDEKNVWFS